MTTQEIIDLLYKGDVKLYEETIRNTNKYVNPINPELEQALQWDTVRRAATCYPEYDRESLFIIDNFLNYVPEPVIYIPHQPFIKSLSASFYRGSISEEQLVKELEFHCKRIRNDDMKKYGWAENRPYNDADYRLYDTHLAVYKQTARERLIDIVGSEPPLEYSLGAEIYLRQLVQREDYHSEMLPTIFDNRAVTITYYKECLLQHGPEAADESMLYGQYLCNYVGISPYTRYKINA